MGFGRRDCHGPVVSYYGRNLEKIGGFGLFSFMVNQLEFGFWREKQCLIYEGDFEFSLFLFCGGK